MYIAEDKSKIYVSIAQGNFYASVKKDSDLYKFAKRRTYKDKDGNMQEKTDIHLEKIIGRITSIEVNKGKFGEQLIVEVAQDDGDQLTIQLPIKGNYADDFMKKIHNVDLTEDIFMKPYAFTPKDSFKEKRGISMIQGREDVMGVDSWTKKLTNYYYDGKKNLHGFPEVKGKNLDTDQWVMYFTETRIFLKKELEKVIEKVKQSLEIDFEGEVPEEAKNDSEAPQQTKDAPGNDLPF